MNVLESVANLFRTEKKTAAKQLTDLVDKIAAGEYIPESDAAEVLKLNGATPKELAAQVETRRRYGELLAQLKKRPEWEKQEQAAQARINESKARLDAETKRHAELLADEWPKVQFARKQLGKLLEAKAEIQGVLPEDAKAELADIAAEQARLVADIRRAEEYIRYNAPAALVPARNNLEACERNAEARAPGSTAAVALEQARKVVENIEATIAREQQTLGELRRRHGDNTKRINVLTHSDL